MAMSLDSLVGRSAVLLLGVLLSALMRLAVAETLLIDNVNGYTLDSSGERQRFQALLIEDGRVVAVGDGESWRGRGDLKRHEGGGRTLLPGLIDAHGHVLGLGHARLTVDLTGTGSLEEALQRVADYATRYPELRWIQGRGWNQELWAEQRFPTAAELDRVVAERPVWLRRVDGHAAWANSRAMELAGVDAGTRAPPGGALTRDAQARPQGVFVDAAMELVSAVLPQPAPAEDARALELALAELASFGITSVHDAGVSARDVALYQEFAEAGKLTVRIYAMLSGTAENLDAFAAPIIDAAGGRLTVRSVKIYADGALGSRGAALLRPYSDDPANRGLLFETPASLRAQIAKANGRGFQVNVHAIGDAGNRQVLDAFAAVQRHRPSSLRNRIEHAQVLTLEDIARFPGLGLTASMQPIHATSDMRMADKRVGPERIAGAYAWQRFLAQGTAIAAGSDFPVESANPFHGFYAAVTRQDQEGRPPGGWHADQAMSRSEALHAFTAGAAYAAHQESDLGSLEPGKWADFVLLDRDPFAVEARELWQIRVLETWLAGTQVYSAR